MNNELTPRDLDTRLNELANKLDRYHFETQKDLVELKVLLATVTERYAERLESHGKELVSQSRRVGKLEDRNWQVAGSIVLGLLGFLGSCALALLTFL